MLYGTTGRADLITHEFGSFCSATPVSGESSTIEEQRAANPALRQDEQGFVDELLAGFSAYPAYYAHMSVINRVGPTPVDLTPPTAIDPAELRRRIDAGEWVIDLRKRTAFAAGDLPGTLGFELSGSFVSYLGWLYDWGAPLAVIGESAQHVAEAQRELVRIGVDRLIGAATGDLTTLSSGGRLGSYPVADFAWLAGELVKVPVAILDVRQSHEHAEEHIPGAANIPLHELAGCFHDVPAGPVEVHCGSGYRASIGEHPPSHSAGQAWAPVGRLRMTTLIAPTHAGNTSVIQRLRLTTMSRVSARA